MTRIRISSIYSHGQPDPPPPSEQRAMLDRYLARLWHELGIPAIRLDDVRDDWTRQAITNEADRQHGKRPQREGRT